MTNQDIALRLIEAYVSSPSFKPASTSPELHTEIIVNLYSRALAQLEAPAAKSK